MNFRCWVVAVVAADEGKQMIEQLECSGRYLVECASSFVMVEHSGRCRNIALDCESILVERMAQL